MAFSLVGRQSLIAFLDKKTNGKSSSSPEAPNGHSIKRELKSENSPVKRETSVPELHECVTDHNIGSKPSKKRKKNEMITIKDSDDSFTDKIKCENDHSGEVNILRKEKKKKKKMDSEEEASGSIKDKIEVIHMKEEKDEEDKLIGSKPSKKRKKNKMITIKDSDDSFTDKIKCENDHAGEVNILRKEKKKKKRKKMDSEEEASGSIKDEVKVIHRKKDEEDKLIMKKMKEDPIKSKGKTNSTKENTKMNSNKEELKEEAISKEKKPATEVTVELGLLNKLKQQLRMVVSQIKNLKENGDPAGQLAELKAERNSLVDRIRMLPFISFTGQRYNLHLSCPDHERQAVLASDVKALIGTMVLPYYKDPLIKQWFQLNRTSFIPRVSVVIVEGVSCASLLSVGLHHKKARKYHAARLQDGGVAPYTGNYNNLTVRSSGAAGDTSTDRAGEVSQQQEDSDSCKESLLQQCLQSWLPRTSSRLSIGVEIISPMCYDHTMQEDLFTLRSGMIKTNRFAPAKKAKTYIFDVPLLTEHEQFPVHALYKQATGKDYHQFLLEERRKALEASAAATAAAAAEGSTFNEQVYLLSCKRRFKIATQASEQAECKPHTWQSPRVCNDQFDRRMLLVNPDYEWNFETRIIFPPCVGQLGNIKSNHHNGNSSANSNGLRKLSQGQLRRQRKRVYTNADFVCTSRVYSKVHAQSPMFSIDCEFYPSINGVHDARLVAVVNEACECVLSVSIKPYAHGHPKELVYPSSSFELEEVQRMFQERLPSDAILVGHDLRSDLQGLRLFHPYLIDTGLLYRVASNARSFNSLKRLSSRLLDKEVQDGAKHNPVEDAVAAMELVLLKLRHDPTYGDLNQGGFVEDSVKVMQDQVPHHHLFEVFELSRENLSNKMNPQTNAIKVCVSEPLVQQWQRPKAPLSRLKPPAHHLTVVPDNYSVLDWLYDSHQQQNKDFSIAHLQKDPRVTHAKMKSRIQYLCELDGELQRVYDSLPASCALVVVFSGDFGNQNGLCLANIKGQEMLVDDALLLEKLANDRWRQDRENRIQLLLQQKNDKSTALLNSQPFVEFEDGWV